MSNAGYYDLAEDDTDGLVASFDAYPNLPDAGENDALDAFVASKHIDIAALVRVGARLAGPTVLAFGFPGGIKFRNMESGQRWATPGAQWHRLKVIRAGAQACDVVIVCEGETDAARLSMLYQADVAVLPAGALGFNAAFAGQLVGYERVLVATDNDAPGEQGYEKIRALVPHAQRCAPPGNDWCEIGPDDPVPPLPAAEAGPDHVGPIVLTDVMPAFRGELPPIKQLVDDVLYESGVHWLFGHPGVGKSLFAMWLSGQVMASQRHVLWLDYEMGLRRTGRRMAAFDVREDHMSEFFHYAWSPGDALAHLEHAHTRWDMPLVVVDSASKSLLAAGLSENENDEVTKWAYRLVQAGERFKMPIIVIDHVAKANGGQYSRGAGAKAADADVQLRLSIEEVDGVPKRFRKGEPGIVRMDIVKDREGEMPFSQWFVAGESDGGMDFSPCSPPGDEAEGQVEI